MAPCWIQYSERTSRGSWLTKSWYRQLLFINICCIPFLCRPKWNSGWVTTFITLNYGQNCFRLMSNYSVHLFRHLQQLVIFTSSKVAIHMFLVLVVIIVNVLNNFAYDDIAYLLQKWHEWIRHIMVRFWIIRAQSLKLMPRLMAFPY